MNKYLSTCILISSTIFATSVNASPYGSKANAINAFNKLQESYQKCMINFNEARDSQYGAPEIKCNDPYNQSLIRFIKDIRSESKKNADVWKVINTQHIKFSQNCDNQTLVKSYNPSFFIRQSFMCESSAYTSLAQVAIDLSY